MTPFHLLLVGVAVYFIVAACVRFFQKQMRQSLFKFLATIFLWGSILAVGVNPGFVKYIGINIVIFVGFVMVFLFLFKLLRIIERIERDVTEIVRQQALKDIAHEKKS